MAKLVTVHFLDRSIRPGTSTTMQIPGKRFRVPKWIHGTKCVVRVEAEAIVPDADASEPCLEPHTLRWLDELQSLADTGDIDALAKVGDVYVRKSA